MKIEGKMPFYKIRDSGVVSEIIDGEAIIMDLKTGIYYSALGVGAVIWDGIVGGFDAAQIKQRINAAFSVVPASQDAEFDAFIQSVLAHNLVTSVPQACGPAGHWSMELPAASLRYSAPFLHRYGDMQDLALLDPIHDVEETAGWPAPRPDEDWPGHKAGT